MPSGEALKTYRRKILGGKKYEKNLRFYVCVWQAVHASHF